MHNERIARLMKALAAKTVANGCTEAEAISAFESLSKLQEEYNTSFNPNTYDEETGFRPYQGAHERSFPVLYAIDAAASVRHVVDLDHNAVLFFGSHHDCEYACYLFAIVNNSMVSSYNKFLMTREYGLARKAKVTEEFIRLSFYAGVVQRLSNRIFAMVSKPVVSSTGRELVVIKASKAQEFMESLGIESHSVSTDVALDAECMAAGEAAGDMVALNRGINGTKPEPLRLVG
jgi:hypothetical protein